MTTAWLMNAVGLFLTMTGALLTFLYLRASPRFADKFASTEASRAYSRHRRLLIIFVGLLSAWLVVQYLGVILV